MKIVLTYGTFDILHYGHINFLKKAKKYGDYLIVGLSTDEFNELKGKKSYYPYEIRKKMLKELRMVDKIIPEKNWDQKANDYKKYHADIIIIGEDWKDDPRFKGLNVKFVKRTPDISTTKIKRDLKCL